MNPIPLLCSVLFAAAPSTLHAPPVEWVYSFADAKAQASSVNKPILIYCWAEGSDYCGKLWQDTLSTGDAVVPMGQFVCFSAKHGADGVQEVFERFGVSTLPTMLFLSPQGQAEDLIQGFIPIDDFTAELDRIRRGEGTVSGLFAQMEAATDGSEADIEARYALAGKVQALGDGERHDELMNSIATADPKGRTLVGARVRMQNIVRELLWASYGKDGDAKDGGGKDGGGKDGGGKDRREPEETDAQRAERLRKLDLEPLYAHVRLVPLAEAKHEAWQQIANLEAQRNDMQAAFDGFRAAWKTCPEEKVVDWSTNLARWVVDNREERTSKEKKFALQLAESALKTLKKRLAEEPPVSDADREKYARYEAYCWNTLAWCRHMNGKKSAAVKAARRALALCETDEHATDLEKISGS